MTEASSTRNWDELIVERLAEAKALRQDATEISNALLKLHNEYPREAVARYKNRDKYHEKLEEFFFQWVNTDEARAPDPRTGKSNEKWRERVWQNAVRNNPELQALAAEWGDEPEGLEDNAYARVALKIEWEHLQPMMELLAAELKALAKR